MKRGLALGGALVLLLAALPFLHLRVPSVFPGPLSSPGTLQLLALCLVFGALAVSYDLLFGYIGLLSFGHALYFSLGVYLPDIALTRWHLSLAAALGLTLLAAVAVPLALGAVCLRVSGIPFAMVTLAFAQAGSILVLKNPHGLTGGEEGLGLDTSALPDALVGVANTRNLYWLALALAALVAAVGWWATRSRPGRVWQAIRENELRVSVLGLPPYEFKLLGFVLSGFLAALAGVVYLLLLGGASPQITTASFSLALLVMVVLGGVGTLWGALLGGVLYQYLDYRLVALSNSAAVQGLPGALRVPLSEPLFILGALFVILVVFFPGGIARLLARAAARRPAGARERSVLERVEDSTV